MAKKILIVDDDPNIRDYIASVLNDNGYDTCTAISGAEGFEMAKAEKPDLITLDLEMPEGWGTALYRKIKRNKDLKDVPVIVITGLEERPASTEAIDHYLSKPFDRDKFISIVRSSIG
jgi:DNA-binding response OmpR family regulator